MSIFVDTSAWYGFLDRSDISHQRATVLINDADDVLLTTDHVLVELSLLARHRLGASVERRAISRIVAGDTRVESTGAADLEKAIAIGEKFVDQDFSLVDRTSWAVMERLGVHEAICFDSDFLVYRFGKNRTRSFIVHS